MDIPGDNIAFDMKPDGLSDIEQPSPVSWYNVGEAWIFILISVGVSYGMGMHLEISIIVSSLRCLIQLTMMGFVLDSLLRSENFVFVMLLTLVLVILGAYELTYIKARNTIHNLFIISLAILLISNVSIAILGTAFTLQQRPFWSPSKFIPVLGILLGKSMSTIAMATHQCLDSMNIHGPILEAKLAMGATRYEAVKPFAIEVIRLSLLPVITQTSVIGLISIPGTLTGQLMAGSSMSDAVIYQQCTMFMLTASSTLGVVMTVVTYMLIIVNEKHALCLKAIVERKPVISYEAIRNTYRSLANFSLPHCSIFCYKRRRSTRKHAKHRYEQVEMYHVPIEKELLYDWEVVMPVKVHEHANSGWH